VAVPCALGQKTFLRSHQQKLQSLKMKNRCKSAKEAKAEHLLFEAAVFSTSETAR